MPGKASMIGFGWEELTKLDRKVKITAKALDGFATGGYYWLEGGGALTRRAALHLAEYLKKTIYTQKAYHEFPGLSKSWQEFKANPLMWGGRTLDPRVGIATENMVKAINAQDAGHGKWRVGISKNERIHGLQIGTYTSIADYAWLLEFGFTGSNNKNPQPPRPAFATMFLEWSNKHMPGIIQPLIDAILPHLKALNREWTGVRYSEWDLAKVICNIEGAGSADESTKSMEDIVDTLRKGEDAWRADHDANVRDFDYDVPEGDTIAQDRNPFERTTDGPAKGLTDEEVMAEGIEIKLRGKEKRATKDKYLWDEEAQRWFTMEQMTQRWL